MGLDMYLIKSTYIGAQYDHRKVTGRISITKDGAKVPINFKRVSEIREEVGYWRKANAIHKWFVDNCQDGADDCREYDVTRENLIELRDLCEKILSNPAEGPEILPTSEGFFFGSQEYNDYYLQDIKNTKKMLDEILADPEDFDVNYYYRASW